MNDNNLYKRLAELDTTLAELVSSGRIRELFSHEEAAEEVTADEN